VLSLLLSLLSAGPSRLSLYNVVLANFTLSSPGLKGGRVLWPLGLLPTHQQTDSAPSRLYLNDIRIVVSAQTIREYVSFLRNNSQTFYTVSGTFVGPWAGGSCGQKRPPQQQDMCGRCCLGRVLLLDEAMQLLSAARGVQQTAAGS
jgi:hypothetical protein